MATATKQVRSKWKDTDRRVRHPLQAVRGYIRQFVILEGLGLTLLYMTLAFWIGLGFDWGLFFLFGFDWVHTLQGLTLDSGVDLYIRGLFLTVIVLGIGTVAVMKTVTRLFREFSDKAMALLLERRFRRELGDRLITAVELADPRKSERYGFSIPLTEKTIRDAAERVERVPIRKVFKWSRLRWIYGFSIGLSLVLFTMVGAAACIVYDPWPGNFALRFRDTAMIWFDRNVLLQDIHWPRQCYLELLGFQGSDDDPREMHVGFGEQREQMYVRAVKWTKLATSRKVVTEGSVTWVHVPGGWTPLMWEDLNQFFTEDELEAVNLPADWDGWVLDQYDDTGDWHKWTVDQVMRQYDNKDVRTRMDCNASLGTILDRLGQLADEAGMGRSVRQQEIPRKVRVFSSTKGASAESTDITPGDNNKFAIGFASVPSTTTFIVRSFIWDGVQVPAGETEKTIADYETPERTISVIPPPSLGSLTADRLEPAYIYYRLKGRDQGPLKGVKHINEGEPLALTGISFIKVASGSDVDLHGELAVDADQGGRRLRYVSVRAPKDEERLEGEKRDRAAIPRIAPQVFEGDVTRFKLHLADIVTTYDFVIEFRDNYNAVGKQRVRIEVQLDDPPEALVEVLSEKQMRKPRPRGKNAKALPPAVMDAWIITPDAVLPLKGSLRDDYGLTAANFVVRVELADVEFYTDTTKKPEPPKDGKEPMDPKKAIEAPPGKDEVKKIKSFIHLEMPLSEYLYSFAEWERLQDKHAVTLDQIAQLNRAEKGSLPLLEGVRQGKFDDLLAPAKDLLALRQKILGDGHVDVARSKRLVAEILDGQGDEAQARRYKDEAISIDRLPRGARLTWEREEDDFKLTNVRSMIEKRRNADSELFRLKAGEKQVQLHYYLYLSVAATDNNVEKGPFTTPGKQPIKFIIVSDNEFLAQIAEDEESLSERLEKAYKSLESSRERFKEQIDRLSSGTPTYKDVKNRLSLAQMYLAESAAVTKEIFREYERIQNHLHFNQAKFPGGPPLFKDEPYGPVADKYKIVDQKIVAPLMRLVEGQKKFDPKFPKVDFPTTEAFVKRMNDDAEKEEGVIPAGRLERHRLEAVDGRERVERLMVQLNFVLRDIQQVVSEGKLRDTLQKLSKEQKDRSDYMKKIIEQIEADTIRELTNPK